MEMNTWFIDAILDVWASLERQPDVVDQAPLHRFDLICIAKPCSLGGS